MVWLLRVLWLGCMLWEFGIQVCKQASRRRAIHCESDVQRWRKANTKVKKGKCNIYECYVQYEYVEYDDYDDHNEFGEYYKYDGYDKY